MILGKALRALSILTLTTLSPAWADEPATHDVPPTCQIAEAAPEDLQSVAELPADLFEIRLKNGMTFELKGAKASDADRLRVMSPEQRQTFFSRRKEMLTFLARFLAFPRTFGAMSWAGNKVTGCFRKSQVSPVEDLLSVQMGASMRESAMLRTLGYQTIAQILSLADEQIWRDTKTFITARSSAIVLFFGLSAGAAAFNIGNYRMYGVQFDFGYDFDTKAGYAKSGLLSQKFKDGLFLFETMFVWGLMRQYQTDRGMSAERSTLVNLPFGLAYRSGENSVSAGVGAGLNFLDVVGTGLISLGRPGLGGSMVAMARLTTFISVYRTEASVLNIQPAQRWIKFREWLQKFMRRQRGCEAKLQPGPDIENSEKEDKQ